MWWVAFLNATLPQLTGDLFTPYMSHPLPAASIEVRTFEGSAAELSRFVLSVWRQDYAGKMAFPLWSPEYFDWQFDLASGAVREQLLAAWCEGELSAVLLGWPFRFRVDHSVQRAILSSWLSVRPEYRGRGVVKALKAEQDRRLEQSGGGLIFAYRYYGSEHSKSKGPTRDQLASQSWDSCQVGFWVRILKARQAARWYHNPWQRRLTLLGAPFTRSPRTPRDRDGIRPWSASDAPAAAALLRSRPKKLVGIDWDESSLARHCSGFGRCLVAERDGEVRGLVSWHVLPFLGATEDPVGVFDIIAVESLSMSDQRKLIESVLAEMKQSGAVLALKLRTRDVPTPSLLSAGFIPWFADSHETVHAVGCPLARVFDRPHHVLWR
jgi:GNAT superfamily N-acetyltransferase